MKHISIDITIDSFAVSSAYHTNVHCSCTSQTLALVKWNIFNFPQSNLKNVNNIVFTSVCVSIKYLR